MHVGTKTNMSSVHVVDVACVASIALAPAFRSTACLKSRRRPRQAADRDLPPISAQPIPVNAVEHAHRPGLNRSSPTTLHGHEKAPATIRRNLNLSGDGTSESRFGSRAGLPLLELGLPNGNGGTAGMGLAAEEPDRSRSESSHVLEWKSSSQAYIGATTGLSASTSPLALTLLTRCRESAPRREPMT